MLFFLVREPRFSYCIALSVPVLGNFEAKGAAVGKH
jgi:hypothetical protein